MPNLDPITLRPHHLLCILHFEGKGYSELFIKNMDKIVRKIQLGAYIMLTDGPDDICNPNRNTQHWHCEDCDILDRDQKALEALCQVFNAELTKGSMIYLDEKTLQNLRNHYREGKFDKACSGCSWQNICQLHSSD